MDRNQADDLNDPTREQRLRGLDRSDAPDSTASSESLVGDSMRATAPRGDALDVDAAARDPRRDDVNPGDEIGEAVGGISGVLTGAALGSLGGPVGTIIGGIAGAVSGWWAGRAISEAASHATNDDDEYYRTHFDGARGDVANRNYDDVRPAYQIGHLAGRNPDYQSRSFDEVERDLRHGWSADVSQKHGQWDEVRDYARHAYERGRTVDASSAGTGAAVGAGVGDALTRGAHGLSNTLDDLKDRVDGNPASRTGHDETDSSMRANTSGSLADRSSGGMSGGMGSTGGVGGTVGNTWDRTTQHLGNAVDDLKDRVDGNPASRPGPDATDASSRLTGGMSAGTPIGSAGLGASGLSPSGLAGPGTTHGQDREIARDASALGTTSDHRVDRPHTGGMTTGAVAGGALGNTVDDLKDRVDGNPASRPGLDATDSPYRANPSGSLGDRAEHTVENAWDKTKDAAHRAADKVEHALDDTKDRVDGNPASRPGVDRTDDVDRRF